MKPGSNPFAGIDAKRKLLHKSGLVRTLKILSQRVRAVALSLFVCSL